MRIARIVGAATLATLVGCTESQGVGGTGQSGSPHAEKNGAKPAASGRVEGELAQERIDAIVAEIMDQQYGNRRDVTNHCWEYAYSDGDAEDDYCMQPAKAEVVFAPSGPQIYLRVANRPDVEDGHEAITPGLMGAFQVAVGNRSWQYVAKAPALPFGSAGYCGCDQAEFVRLGSEFYGWKFTSGGTWQGVTVSNHEIVAPHGDVFVDVSDVPAVQEEHQDVSYAIEVRPDGGDIFPIKVTKSVSGKPDGERFVNFDKEKWLYRMPEMF